MVSDRPDLLTILLMASLPFKRCSVKLDWSCYSPPKPCPLSKTEDDGGHRCRPLVWSLGLYMLIGDVPMMYWIPSARRLQVPGTFRTFHGAPSIVHSISITYIYSYFRMTAILIILWRQPATPSHKLRTRIASVKCQTTNSPT